VGLVYCDFISSPELMQHNGINARLTVNGESGGIRGSNWELFSNMLYFYLYI